MRDIIFRGMRVDTGEWVEGKGVDLNFSDAYIFTKGYDGTSGYYEDDFEVIPQTLGQYTGLTDENGTCIFEGDIIAGAANWLGRYKNGVVVFKHGSFGVAWYRGSVEQFNAFTSMCNIKYEVIGNIHNNPELLEMG